MGSVQGTLQSLPLVHIWVSQPSPQKGKPLGEIQVNPRCGSRLGRFGTPWPQIFALASSHTHPYIGCCNSGILSWMRNSTARCSQILATVLWREGGVSGYMGQFIYPAFKNFVLVVRSQPAVAYLFPTGMYCLFEQGLWKSSIICPVGTDPGPVGVCQALVVFLGRKGFLRRGSPMRWA